MIDELCNSGSVQNVAWVTDHCMSPVMMTLNWAEATETFFPWEGRVRGQPVASRGLLMILHSSL